MTETDEIDARTVRRNWARYVQSPAQLAFSRIAKFPPGSGERLAETLRVQPDERILEIGSGMGILGSRLLESGRPARVWGLEVEREYLNTDLPEGLRPATSPVEIRGNGFRIPFPRNSVDRVLTHTLVNLLDEEERERLHEEIRRVLGSGGTVTHMDGIGGDTWTPDALVPPEEEQERRRGLFDLLESVHEELGTGFTRSVKNLPELLVDVDFRPTLVDVHASALRLNDDAWSEPQRKLMLELRQRADRDRVERLRNLLEATGGMTEGEAQLLRRCVGDAQQQALRRRKALENNRELGWRSSSTLIASANP